MKVGVVLFVLVGLASCGFFDNIGSLISGKKNADPDATTKKSILSGLQNGGQDFINKTSTFFNGLANNTAPLQNNATAFWNNATANFANAWNNGNNSLYANATAFFSGAMTNGAQFWANVTNFFTGFSSGNGDEMFAQYVPVLNNIPVNATIDFYGIAALFPNTSIAQLRVRVYDWAVKYNLTDRVNQAEQASNNRIIGTFSNATHTASILPEVIQNISVLTSNTELTIPVLASNLTAYFYSLDPTTQTAVRGILSSILPPHLRFLPCFFNTLVPGAPSTQRPPTTKKNNKKLG